MTAFGLSADFTFQYVSINTNLAVKIWYRFYCFTFQYVSINTVDE